MTVEIPLKRKYLCYKPVKQTKHSGGGQGVKKRPNYHKGRYSNILGHVQWVMVLLPSGKRRFMPQAEWEAQRAAEAA